MHIIRQRLSHINLGYFATGNVVGTYPQTHEGKPALLAPRPRISSRRGPVRHPLRRRDRNLLEQRHVSEAGAHLPQDRTVSVLP